MPSLLTYQISGSNFLTPRVNAGLLDGMRLGKTRQSLAAARNLYAKNVLVICKASGIANWVREAQEWGFRTQVITSKTTALIIGTPANPVLYVVSYNAATMAHVKAFLISHWYTVCIIDEAHYLKNRQSGRTKAVYGEEINDNGIASRASVRWLLTGTFWPNYPDEVWTHLHALMPATIHYHSNYPMSYWQFRDRYCKTYDEKVIGMKNLNDLRARLKGWTLRRTKEQVWKDVPPMQVSVLPIAANMPKLSEDEARLMAQLERCETEAELLTTMKRLAPHFATLRRITGMAKVKGVVDWVSDNLEQLGKVVLFAHHKEVMAGLGTGCEKFTNVVSITGGLSPTEREARRCRFMEDDKVGVLVGQNFAAGDSIALHASDTVLLCEPDWTPGQNDQCLDRVSHFEKKWGCTGYFVAIPNSADEHLMDVLARKSIENYNRED